MHITEKQINGVVVLVLKGRLTAGGSDLALRDRLATLAQIGNRNILLNLGGVSYLDSAGLSALIGGLTSLRAVGGKLRLLNLTRRIHDLIVICKLVDEFECFDVEAHAIGSFKERWVA